MIEPVKIISVTNFPTHYGDNSLDSQIAYVARVSNPSGQLPGWEEIATEEQTSKDLKLIKYLMKHKHWSPFEMSNVCLEINTTRDIARQILRHRSFSFQEFSQRYSVVPESPVFKDARLQDTKNRQNSIETDDSKLRADWMMRQAEVVALARDVYQWALDSGIAKEQARAVLPEGNTMSRLYMNGSVRSWVHYLQLRCHKDTQREHRELAENIRQELCSLSRLIFQKETLFAPNLEDYK